MDEQEANDQNKSPEAPEDYKLPEAYDLLEEHCLAGGVTTTARI